MGKIRSACLALIIALTGLLVSAQPAQSASDTYANYAALAASQVAGQDYRIRMYSRDLELAVIAIHAGGIETGMSELARAIAGEGRDGRDWSEYRFEGLLPSGNGILHITSTNFDEPLCLWLVGHTSRILSVHGMSGSTPVIYVGGLDTVVRDLYIQKLVSAGFNAVVPDQSLAGIEPSNIVNKGTTHAGVQVEISSGYRSSWFGTNTAAQRWATRTAEFEDFVTVTREVMEMAAVAVG